MKKLLTVREYLTEFQQKFPEELRRKALILYIIQVTLISLLLFTLVMIVGANTGERRAFYFALTAGLMLILVGAFHYNQKGKYKISSLLTVISTLLGPWGAIFLDKTIAAGDIVPLIYIILPIQLCSIFLTEIVTVIIASAQFLLLLSFILLNPQLLKINWPSLICLILFSSTLGIVISYVNRKQMEQIDSSRVKLLESERRLLDLSVRDSLTGLFNRRYMEETLEREIGRALDNHQSIGIIMTDLDGFKIINDTYGHAIGDLVLSETAEILTANIRKTDIACRYGGDEFILILPECTLTDTEKIGEKLKEAMNTKSFKDDGGPDKVTLSIGVASLPANGRTKEAVFKAADKALYNAKNSGRNRISVSEEKFLF